MVEKGVGETFRMEGVAASEGVAIGPVFVHDPGVLKPEREAIPEDIVEEEISGAVSGCAWTCRSSSSRS